jgi:ribosomal subunit interface protein
MRLEIRGRNVKVSAQLKAHVERRLEFALDAFGDRVDASVVRFSDPGDAKVCEMALRLRPSGSVRVRQAGEDLYVAVDQCAERAARAVARAVERKRPRRKAAAARKPALRG